MVQIYADICAYKKPFYLSSFFICAVVQVVLTSAPLFGYSSMLVIFKDLKLYQHVCMNDEKIITENSTSHNFTTTPEIFSCNKQDKALNLPFAFGIILHTGVKVFIGYVVDYTGAKTSQYIGCIFLMMFGITLAYVAQGLEYLIFVAFFFLSISSSLLMLCPYQVVNVMYKKRKALLMSILSGSVDGSTVIFIIFLDIYQKGVSLSFITIGYVILCTILLMLVACLLYPSKENLLGLVEDDVRSNLHPTPDQPIQMYAEDFTASYMSSYSMYYCSIQKTLDEFDEAEKRESILSSLSHSLALQWSQSSNYSASMSKPTDFSIAKPYGTITENVVGFEEDVHVGTASYFVKDEGEKEKLINPQKETLKITPYAGLSLRHYVFSWLFVLYAYLSAVIMLKIVYFIANLDKFLLEMTDYETATRYTKYFGYVQFSGVLVAPVCSLLFLQRSKEKNGIPLAAEEDFLEKARLLILPSVVLVAVGLLLNGLQMIQHLQLSIPIFILFLVCNSLLWCLISLYLAFLFPAKYYCTLMGINNGVCSVISFIQYPLLSMEKDVFGGRQFNTNAIFMVLIGSCAVLPLYLCYFYKTFKTDDSVVRTKDEEQL